MSEQRGSPRVLGLVTTGLVIGAVEVVLAISFASLVFGGYLYQYLADGIGLYLVAGALTLAIVAWRAGNRRGPGQHPPLGPRETQVWSLKRSQVTW